MAKHRHGWKEPLRGWMGWLPFRRPKPDPVSPAALTARVFAEAPTELLPIYSEHLEVCVDRTKMLDGGQAVTW
ncbi:hypothetical protein [Nocardia tengchongensis]|uniref:hypothetical protein n=1 Tax=Nocardia tengchongensis TaxID=2055889 RepID=UPI0036674163